MSFKLHKFSSSLKYRIVIKTFKHNYKIIYIHVLIYKFHTDIIKYTILFLNELKHCRLGLKIKSYDLNKIQKTVKTD